MSLNLQINILSDNGHAIGQVDLPQINIDDTFFIIGQDNNVKNQIERLIIYFEKNKHYNRDYKFLRGVENLDFTFI